MDFAKCRNHPEVILGSKIENHTGLCLACVEVKIARIAELEVIEHKYKVEHEELVNANAVLIERVQKFQSMMKAEVEGVSAANNGMTEEQNPYPDGDELCVMWLNGHQSVETRRRTAQAMAVIDWSNTCLQTIQELARGYGQLEIADKIGTVVQKLEPFHTGG
jgi:hypothetical protein